MARQSTPHRYTHRTTLATVLQACVLAIIAGSTTVTFAGTDGFSGVINTELQDSTPDWPDPKLPQDGSPNVLIWMIDDAGIGHVGAFGGVVETPNLDKLAGDGLSFTNFHATPVCSASRAALLTGRNPHRAHIGAHSGAAIGFPGYDAHIPESMASIADILGSVGYATYALGKWDQLPTEDATAAGPFDYWPSGQGFDKFYGFLAADTDNFNPNLWTDHSPLNLPVDDPTYHLSADMADKAIQWISDRESLPRKPPFLMYWASGAIHAPHHAPSSLIKYYNGRFDEGWDKARNDILAKQKALGVVPANTRLSPRPDGMPPWDSLTASQKKSYARAMEVLAAQMTYTDQQFGRILQHLENSGELDNTLIIVVSDNGASAEGGLHGTFSEHMFFNGRHPDVETNLTYYDKWGGPETYPHVPMGWAVVGNTPFRYYKQTAFEGGTRVPMILSWPKGIKPRGEVRDQYHFITDIAPTILAAAQIAQPEEVAGVKQETFDGVDMSYAFDDPTRRSKRETQYIEKMGNRSIYSQGWKAVNNHRPKTWEMPPSVTLHNNWELYHLENDINELNNLAEKHPEKLKNLLSLFDREATANNVYPIISSPSATRNIIMADMMKSIGDRSGLYTYRTPVSRIPEKLAPPIMMGSSIKATIGLTPDQTKMTGPIFAVGGRLGGISLYLVNGRAHFMYRNVDNHVSAITAPSPLPTGESAVDVEIVRLLNGAHAMMRTNGKTVGEVKIPGPLAGMFSLHETFDVGSDSGSPVAYEYVESPEFSGDLKELRIQISAPRQAPGQ